MNCRKYPRSMTEAFGPYTSGELEDAERQCQYSLVWCLAMCLASIAALVVIGVTL